MAAPGRLPGHPYVLARGPDGRFRRRTAVPTPERYCESDRLIGFASRHFRDINEPHDVLAAVSSWVGTQLEYVSGSSGPTDGAVDTLLAARGVCRDYAHLAVALLRAMEIPARLVAVYAPGLSPMDFHAVAEACLDGAWYVVDGTLLAPRQSLVRIATGRDAADISFLSSYGAPISLGPMTVTATVEGDLPTDDVPRSPSFVDRSFPTDGPLAEPAVCPVYRSSAGTEPLPRVR